MNIQEKLKTFAFNVAYPYLLDQPVIREHLETLCFLLVGSTATGLCSERSDVDICILCHQETFDSISIGTRWAAGRPTEAVIDGIQLHYYAISVEDVLDRIHALNDVALYVYDNAIVLNDNINAYQQIKDTINSAEIVDARITKSFDLLTRRTRALNQVLSGEKDPFLRLNVSVELLELLLVCIALKDRLQFDKRKRFYLTALAGTTGQKLKGHVDRLLTLLGQISAIERQDTTHEFLEIFDDCCLSVLQDYSGSQ